MTVLRSALGGNKFHDICDMETIPPETDVLIKTHIFHHSLRQNSHFEGPKLPAKWTITAVVKRVKSSPTTDSNCQVDNFKPIRAGRVIVQPSKYNNIGAFSLLGTVTVTDVSLLT